jgi:hypothetical protein
MSTNEPNIAQPIANVAAFVVQTARSHEAQVDQRVGCAPLPAAPREPDPGRGGEQPEDAAQRPAPGRCPR